MTWQVKFPTNTTDCLIALFRYDVGDVLLPLLVLFYWARLREKKGGKIDSGFPKMSLISRRIGEDRYSNIKLPKS